MTYDISVIRPEMKDEYVKPRGRALGPDRRRAQKKALQTLHALEVMAVNIYKCQITSRISPLNTALTIAMCNEMTHLQDFQTKLYEHGFKPSKLRGRFWLVGYVFGLGSRLLGTKRVLKTGIWAEEKAVEHYGRLLASAEWDDETRWCIEKDWADERGHIARWKGFLESPGGSGPSGMVDTENV